MRLQPSIPPEYIAARESLGFDEISIDVGGVQLFRIAEIPEGQVGYSVSPEGRSLCDGSPGSWNPAWIVIGIETTCGDPIILDTSTEALRVLSAMHGEGTWEPEPIAYSIYAFVESLQEVKRIAVGRENPVQMENNPLPAAERTDVLQRIARLNDRDVYLTFWELLLGG